MITNRADYLDLAELNKRIPENEPVILFRAQDELMADVIEFYVQKRKSLYGSNDQMAMDLEHFNNHKIRTWKPKKKADLPEPKLEADQVDGGVKDDTPDAPTVFEPDEEKELKNTNNTPPEATKPDTPDEEVKK